MGIPVLLGTADYVATAQVAEVVGEGGQGPYDIIDVGHVFLPLDLLAFAPGEAFKVNRSGHTIPLFSPCRRIRGA